MRVTIQRIKYVPYCTINAVIMIYNRGKHKYTTTECDVTTVTCFHQIVTLHNNSDQYTQKQLLNVHIINVIQVLLHVPALYYKHNMHHWLNHAVAYHLYQEQQPRVKWVNIYVKNVKTLKTLECITYIRCASYIYQSAI